jgi:NhaP-type Na+/H+ or K+/H+ antiporter
MEIINCILYSFSCLVGVLAHFLKKKIKGETLSDIKHYFSTHLRETVITLIGAIFGLSTALYIGDLNILTAFTIGYTADSMFNKSQEKLNNKANNN